MALPPLLTLKDEQTYRAHFEREYCLGTIYTQDGIRVYFPKGKFNHAFYEAASGQRGPKSKALSMIRVQRMDWIKATLADPNADWFQGWDNKNKRIDETSRVEVVYENFVVILAFSLKCDGTLKANFVTCYQADNSIDKIRNNPAWNKHICIRKLKEKKNSGR